jgi:hypothetical protein
VIARFRIASLGGLDEPVRRYFGHAIREGASLSEGSRLTMVGRIKVGRWLPFRAGQTLDGNSFRWSARVGWGPVTPLTVLDSYADGQGVTEGRLLGRLRVFGAADADVSRSAVGRLALE